MTLGKSQTPEIHSAISEWEFEKPRLSSKIRIAFFAFFSGSLEVRGQRPHRIVSWSANNMGK
jgi:hypothetical protein